MNTQTLLEVFNTLNQIEVHGKKNLAGLLVSINKIEEIIREEQENDLHTETESKET